MSVPWLYDMLSDPSAGFNYLLGVFGPRRGQFPGSVRMDSAAGAPFIALREALVHVIQEVAQVPLPDLRSLELYSPFIRGEADFPLGAPEYLQAIVRGSGVAARHDGKARGLVYRAGVGTTWQKSKGYIYRADYDWSFADQLLMDYAAGVKVTGAISEMVEKAKAAKRAIAENHDIGLVYGDVEVEQYGLLNHPSVPSYSWTVTSGATVLANATDAEVFTVIQGMIDQFHVNSNYMWQSGKKLVLQVPPALYQRLTTKRTFLVIDSSTDVQSLYIADQLLLANKNSLKAIEPNRRLTGYDIDGAASASSNWMHLYAAVDADVAKIGIPVDFRELPTYQESAMEWVIPCIGIRTGAIYINPQSSLRAIA